MKLELGPVAPVVLALSEQQLHGLSISGPRSVHLGETADSRISPNADSAAARDVIHIEIADPDGNIVPYYSGNLLAPAGATSCSLPLAVNDKAGMWTIRANGLLTGGTATTHLQVEPCGQGNPMSVLVNRFDNVALLLDDEVCPGLDSRDAYKGPACRVQRDLPAVARTVVPTWEAAELPAIL